MRRRSPLVAALLSAIIPGAGQAYQGRVGPALLFVAPLAILVAGAGAAMGVASLPQIAGWFLLPGVLTTVLVLDVALLAWRVAAVVDAWRAGLHSASARAARLAAAGAATTRVADEGVASVGPGRAAATSAPSARERGGTAAVAVALVVVLLAVSIPHVVAGVYVASASSAVSRIFAAPDADPLANVDATPGPSLAGDAAAIAMASPSVQPSASAAVIATLVPTGSPTADPTASPSPTATPLSKRLNVLLLGIDSGPGRSEALTDTMIVVSLDPIGRTVSMMSVPRDTVNAPLGGGMVYQPKLNSLLGFAERNPGAFPGKKPVRVLKDTLGRILGIPIQYYASVDLPGFIQVVDAIGGVGVYVKEPLYDGRYKEYGFRGFSIDVGCHHMDGKTALAYARIRYSLGQNDFTRAGRQQQVLVAARDRAVRAGLLLDVPALLDALGQTVRTDIPATLVPQIAELAIGIDAGRVSQAVVQPPLVAYGTNGYGSVLLPDLPAILAVADGLFTQPGVAPVGWPAPTPTTTPKPGHTSAPTPACA